MNTHAVHESVRLLPPDSAAYGPKPRPLEAHQRWAEASNDPHWAWRIAFGYYQSQESLPPSIGDKNIRRNERLEGGESWGSVVLAAGRLYVTRRKGVTTVFRPNPEKLEVLAMNDLGESSNATPAISDGQIFLRTDGHLYCIAEN